METQTNNFPDSSEGIHRRVQQRIAGRYLDLVDPDGAIAAELHKDKFEQFREADPQLKKKFDEQHRQFEKTGSIYSIQNVCWIIAAMGVFYYTDIYLVVLYDRRVNRPMFNFGLILASVTGIICAFFVFWLSFVKKVNSDDWERLYPSAIPIATGCFVFGSIFLTIGLWPVWGLLTPVILFILFMGIILTIAMIPGF